MNVVKVRNIEIGTGIPKICVPIVGTTKKEILSAAAGIRSAGADVVEWRVDWYLDIFQFDKVTETLAALREALADIPLLFTFRTAKEGGEKDIEPNTYIELLQKAAKSGYVDMIDAELFTGDDAIRKIIAAAHSCGVKVILSNHDFHHTPNQQELVTRLCQMRELGADIPKIAVMPESKKDVLTLLAATEEAAYDRLDCPIITMSMAGTGVISRLAGEIFGSALTFGAVGKASAPGQIGVKDLHNVLDIIHKSI